MLCVFFLDIYCVSRVFFFFQAEDGIRDATVTGVQTCALPIYLWEAGKERRSAMDVAARLTSKGQVTLPKVVREALGLEEGDQVVFQVEGHRVILARTADLLDLAGAVARVPQLMSSSSTRI